MPSTPYVAQGRPPTFSPEELRARIPGWGVDADPAVRPSVPQELSDGVPAHAHWDVPESQPELEPRERSIEHSQLTPVFGTTLPPRGVSGAMRRLSYRKFSEARAAHWLFLLAADRVEVVEQGVQRLAGRRGSARGRMGEGR